MVRKSHRLIVDTRKINDEPTNIDLSTSESTVLNNNILTTELNSKYLKENPLISKTKNKKMKLKLIQQTIKPSLEKISTSNITPYVTQTKLLSQNKDNLDLYSIYILYGMMGSLGIILGTVFIYILLKPSKDDQPIEKKNLIDNELCQDGRILHV